MKSSGNAVERHKVLGVVLGIASMGLSAPASAQDGEARVGEIVPHDELKARSDERLQGWDGLLDLSSNVAFSHSANVVGQGTNGTSVLIGLTVLGALDYRKGRHAWLNAVSLTEGFARTPAADSFVKTSDTLALQSLYAYYFLKWLGGFGRVTMEAPILVTDDVRGGQTTYVITRLDQATPDTPMGESLKLGNPFQPITLTESAGLVVNPIDTEPAAVFLRIGVGGRETFARGFLAVDDDDSTEEIEVRELDNVIQAGGEVALGINGRFPERRLSYGIDGAVLFPVLNNDDMDRSVGELARISIAANASFSMFEWLSLQYKLSVIRDQQLFEKTQVQNNLFLTFKYTLIPRREVPEEDKPMDPALKAALDKAEAAAKKAEEADKRAADAEAKAMEAEQKAAEAEARAKEAAEKAAEPAPEPTPEPEPAPEPAPE